MSPNASPSAETILFYSKSTCPWANAVRHVLDQSALPYEERPIDKNSAFLESLRSETGQEAQPTLKIGADWLLDTDAKAVAKHLGLPEPAAVKMPA